MLIFWDKRLVFLATPKAGSTAIETALESLANVAVQRPAQLKHTNLRDYRRHIEPWLHEATGDTFLTVAMMREPVEWLRSWYRFHSRDEADELDGTMPDMGFSTFASSYAESQDGTFQDIGTQSSFLTSGSDRVDRIFRYEHMDAFTQFLEDTLDCAISLPRLNVPPAVDVSLDPKEEQALRKSMTSDFRLYDSL